MAVGQSILTVAGLNKILDGYATNKPVAPKFFKVSSQDIQLDPGLLDISGVWKEGQIDGVKIIDNNTIEFIIDIPVEEAIDYGKIFGLYLEDGTLFMLAKPPYPFPPSLRQTFKIQLAYNNISQMVDFKYIPSWNWQEEIIAPSTSALWDAIHTLTLQVQSLALEIEKLKNGG